MGNSWFRSWHNAPTDPKWLAIAQRINTERNRTQPNAANAGTVSAVFWALMDHASQADDRGDISSFDVEAYSAFSGFDAEIVRAIVVALNEKKLIIDNRLVAWEKRQPKREDGSAERAKEWRERNRTQPNAKEHREDKIRKKDIMSAEADESQIVRRETLPLALVESPKEVQRAKPPDKPTDSEFDEWYRAYPRHIGRGKALKAYRAARRKADKETLLAGALRAAKDFSDPQFTPHPASWLNAERWADEAAATKPKSGNFVWRSGIEGVY